MANVAVFLLPHRTGLAHELSAKVSNRITNEVAGVNLVILEITIRTRETLASNML